MTLLQMTGMYQAIANDGVRIPPRIVKATVAPDGTRTEEPRPEGVRVVSPQTAQTVRAECCALWCSATRWAYSRAPGRSPRSTATRSPAKTGTAQKINPACGCYYSDVYWITFAGMVTTDDPRYVDRHHGRQPAPHRRGTAGHDDGAAVPQHRELVIAAGERAAVARPRSAADFASHLTSRGTLSGGRYCVMAMKLRPCIPSARRSGRWPTGYAAAVHPAGEVRKSRKLSSLA